MIEYTWTKAHFSFPTSKSISVSHQVDFWSIFHMSKSRAGVHGPGKRMVKSWDSQQRLRTPWWIPTNLLEQITPQNVLVLHFNFKCKLKRNSLILLNFESKTVSCCETVRHVRSRYRYFRADPSGLPEVRLNICSPSSSPEHQRPSNIEPCEYWLCGKWIWVCLIDMHSQEGYFRTKTAYWILSLRLELEALALAGRVAIGFPVLGRLHFGLESSLLTRYWRWAKQVLPGFPRLRIWNASQVH